MDIIKLILSIIVMVILLFFMDGFFNVCRLENKNGLWKPFPKRKPKKAFSAEKKRTFLVSLENMRVTFCEYDFDSGRFEIDEVDAWKEVPVCYASFKKMCRNIIERVREKRNDS